MYTRSHVWVRKTWSYCSVLEHSLTTVCIGDCREPRLRPQRKHRGRVTQGLKRRRAENLGNLLELTTVSSSLASTLHSDALPSAFL